MLDLSIVDVTSVELVTYRVILYRDAALESSEGEEKEGRRWNEEAPQKSVSSAALEQTSIALQPVAVC
ncbi:hypothetical protein OPV22_030365 [Ensete ventricosum]|uniref:Uncharacterized protein n=1 Tax=Ensete ventricosum TaxID=4639 RepID=A0AAV8Q3W6_ENSVE|nr:hypothetical protein OPV22_030365 [Ensete ventricosum]